MTLLYSMIAKNLEDSKQIFAQNLFNILCSLGVMVGPIIGGYLYRIFGYQVPFLIMAIANFVTFALVNVLLSPKIDFELKD